MVNTKELAKSYTSVSDTHAGIFLFKKIGNPVGMRLLDVDYRPDNLTVHIVELVDDTESVIGVDPSRKHIAIAVA